MKRFKEDVSQKFRFIDRNPNLDEWEMNLIKEFFTAHPEQANFIKNWNNNIPYETFSNIMDNYYNNNTPKDGIDTLSRGWDYDYIGEDGRYDYYAIHHYEASVVFASNNVGKEVWSDVPNWYNIDNVRNDYPYNYEKSYAEVTPLFGGAKWCISMNHTDKFWNDYTNSQDLYFIFAIEKKDYYNNDCYENKLAISIHKYSFPREDSIKVYDAADDDIDVDSDIMDFLLENKEKIASIFKIYLAPTYPDRYEFEDYYESEEYIAKSDLGDEIVSQYERWCSSPLIKYDSIIDFCQDENYDNVQFVRFVENCITHYFNYIPDSYLSNVHSKEDLLNYVFDMKKGFFIDKKADTRDSFTRLVCLILADKHDDSVLAKCLFQPLIDRDVPENHMRGHSLYNYINLVNTFSDKDTIIAEIISILKETGLDKEIIDERLGLNASSKYEGKDFVSLDGKNFFYVKNGWYVSQEC